MKKPVLVIMAAGMGSRYGGLKQVDPVDADGHIIMDFSIYDAVRAGFKKVIFIIKRENEQIFRETIGRRVEGILDVEYVFQELENIPDGFAVPEGRIKPWGTGHAVLSCLNVIDGPFAVINADDYYGPGAFAMIYDYLTHHEDDSFYRYTMVGYRLGNTLTENGHVSRGICTVDENGYLTGIRERTYIVMTPDGAAYSEDDGLTLTAISPDERVSMNMWGFTSGFMKELQAQFAQFLEEDMPKNPLKAEYFLPSVVSRLLDEGKATVKVLHSNDKWYGVTYKEDKAAVMAAIAGLKQQGVYPDRLIEM
ncbi:MAG: sugar phosphate nucleotidyltransferase [Coprococcus sp.]